MYGPSALRNSHAYQYNDASQRTQHKFSDGTSPYEYSFTDYTYDDIGQLKTANGTDHAYDAGTAGYLDTTRKHEQFGYTYDAAWNLATKTNNALVQTFNVDSLNQLTTATRSGTLTVAGSATERRGDVSGYPYGVTNVAVSGTGLSTGLAEIYADGSWARTNASPVTNGTSTYTATALDTYGRTSQDSVSVTLPGGTTFKYDGNGNLTNDSVRVFEYDTENQLTNVYVASTWRSTFHYDAFGRRRVRKEYTWQSSAWVLTNEVHYVYDGMLVIQERDSSNNPRVSYTRGNDLSGTLQGAGGIGGLLARTDLSTITPQLSTALYHADGNGNITCLMQTNGLIVARYSYEPFGKLLTMSGPLAEANCYRFSSKEWHDNSGLYYYGFRFYEPALQRWLNRDPLADHGSLAYTTTAAMPDTDSGSGSSAKDGEDSWAQVNQNLHGFLVNAPLTWIDPLGFVISCSGQDKEKWQKFLDNWRKNLPKDSRLRKVVDDLDKSTDTVTIGPLTGRKDNQGKQPAVPYTEKTPLGNARIWIDYGKSYNYDNDPSKRKYSNPEALAHEMLHAHDNLIDKNYRDHGEGFWDDEKGVTEDARKCPSE